MHIDICKKCEHLDQNIFTSTIKRVVFVCTKRTEWGTRVIGTQKMDEKSVFEPQKPPFKVPDDCEFSLEHLLDSEPQ